MGRIRQLFDNEQVLQPDATGFFTPDTELALKIIEQKDKDLDDLEDLRGKLQEKLAIAHMDTANDTREARDLLESYQHEADNIAMMAMNDRLNTGLYKRYLHDLQGRMVKDMQSGRWYDLTKRAADEKAWKEQNAHILKEDPTLYNRIYDRYMQEHEDLGRKYAEEGVSSWRVPWQAIVPKPNLTSDQMLKAYSLAKENMWDEQRGMYIYKNTEISEEEAGRIALNSLLSDANFYGYAAQQARLGDKGYLNDEGEIIPPMIIDSHGRPQWNPRSAFAPDLQLVQDIIAHKQQHITPDQVKIAAANRAAAASHGSGRGKEEKSIPPFKSEEYITPVKFDPTSIEQVDQDVNRIRKEKNKSPEDLNRMEQIQQLQKVSAEVLVDEDGNTITFGQLGINDGPMWDTHRSHDIKDEADKSYVNYADKKAVDDYYGRMERIFGNLNDDQRRTLMFGRSMNAYEPTRPQYFDWTSQSKHIGGMSQDYFNMAMSIAKARGYVIVKPNNTDRAYGVEVITDPKSYPDKRPNDRYTYSYNDIQQIGHTIVAGFGAQASLAKAMRDVDAQKILQSTYAREHKPMLTRTADLLGYSSYLARWYGLTAWTIENDPIVAALLPGGQYVKPTYTRVIPEENQFGQSKHVNNNGTAIVYAVKNNSTKAYWKSVASNMTEVLKHGIKQHNETVIQVSSVPMVGKAKEQFSRQLSLLSSADGGNAARFTMFNNGTNNVEETDNINKVLGALANGEATLSVSAGIPKGDGKIMLSISTKALDPAEKSEKTYQVFSNDNESSMALLSIATRNMDPRTPSYKLFANKFLQTLVQKFSEVKPDASGSSSIVVASGDPGSKVPAFKIFKINGQFFVYNVNSKGELCDDNGIRVNIGTPNEAQWILRQYKGVGFSSLSDMIDQSYSNKSNK